MKELESTILELLKNKGITNVTQANWGVGAYISGMKIEWCTVNKCLKVGVGNSKEDNKIIRESLLSEDFELSERAKSNSRITTTTVEEYERLLEWAESFELTLTNPLSGRSSRGKVERPDYDEVSPYTQLAKRVKFAVDTQDPGVLNRDIMDLIDGNITIAQSIAYKNGGSKYREHAVPCDLLYREAVVMYEEGKPLYEIAAMFKNNLAIVLITPEEARLLDSELGLKTEMPTGWSLGDSIFERFNFANIKLELV